MRDWKAELKARADALDLPPEDEADLIEELSQHLEDEFSTLAPLVGEAEAEAQLLARLDDGAFRRLGRARREAIQRSEGGQRRLATTPGRLLGDIQYAVRRAGKRSGFTAIAVLSLAIGIGANAAIFSLLDALLLRRAPVPHREQLVQLYVHDPTFAYTPFSYPDYVALRDASGGAFQQISLSVFSVVPRDMGDHVETLFVEMVNGDYFPLLGLSARTGRLLGPDDVIGEGAHPVAVLSSTYWHDAFAGDPGVVGRQIRIAGRAYTIVGVAPKDYEGTIPGIPPALFLPITMMNEVQPSSSDQLADRDNHSAFVTARMAPGTSLAKVRSVTSEFSADMQRRFPKSWPKTDTTLVVPKANIVISPIIDSVVVPAAVTLVVVVALVLLVACANLASFLLAQARDRQREIAIRIALGANRLSLVRQLLVEALVLAAVGGTGGVVLSRLALGALLRIRLPIALPVRLDVGLDGRVLAFAVAVTALVALLIGLLPALRATRPNAVEVIKSENTGGGSGGRRLTLRSGLVIGQIAVSLVLLVTASLFLRSLQAREHIDPGFGHQPAGMVWFMLSASPDSLARQRIMLEDVEDRARRIAGVQAVGVTDNMLLNVNGSQGMYINVAGVQPPSGAPGFEVDYSSVDSGFFSASGVTLLRGRGIEAGDGPGSPPVAVITEAMAARFWPHEDPIGQAFRNDSTIFSVVGVCRSVKVRSLSEPPRPYFFTSFAQRSIPYVMLVARTSRNAESLTPQLVAALREVDPSIMIMQGTTMSRHLSTMMVPARLGAMAFGLFAAAALALAMIGVYGVVSYAVARRSREVGIRMALGAGPRVILGLLMREGIMLVAAGSALGVVAALLVTRALQRLLTGVAAVDPITFLGVPLVLAAVGVLAAFVPARRSTRTDPVRVLKAE